MGQVCLLSIQSQSFVCSIPPAQHPPRQISFSSLLPLAHLSPLRLLPIPADPSRKLQRDWWRRGKDGPAPPRPRPALPPPTALWQKQLYPERTPKHYGGSDLELGLGFECSRMTSKGGGWGWRLVTGATQGGPTCPTRSGPALHRPPAQNITTEA